MYFSIALNMLYLIVPLVALIAALYVMQKTWCAVFGHKSIYLTGWIGTPIHEISHVLMCIIFGHKVEEVSLFKPEPDSGVLGYVVHRYDPKSFYQSVGCLFIGMAPLFGNIVLALTIYNIAINNPEFLGHQLTWLPISYIIFSLVMHAAPSPADLRGSMTGVATIVVILLPVIGLFPEQSVELTENAVSYTERYLLGLFSGSE